MPSVFHQVETLEQRRVLAFDFVSAYVAEDAPFYVTNATSIPELSQAPQQITLRFTPGVEVAPESLAEGISIVRSGGAKDLFGNDGSFEDVTIIPGALLVDDFPSQNQVVVRFSESLPDDIYRITISSTGLTGLRTVAGESFRGGESFSFDFRLDVGQQIRAVVPQPITRSQNGITGGLSQDRDTIEIYFDNSESLNKTSVENPDVYRLIEINKTDGSDISGSEKTPASVVYDPDSTNHKALLTFAPGDLADGKLYRLEIGGPGILETPAAVAEPAGEHDSFATATSLGVVSQSGILVSGSVNARAEIDLPGNLPSLHYPTQDGTVEEPGHRNVPIDDGNHGLPVLSTRNDNAVHTVAYNFRSDYGSDPQGNPLENVITSEQKIRVREIFDLFSRYAGIRFVETAERGITVVTGDTRVISDNSPTSVLRGLARGGVENGEVSEDALAIVNSTIDWKESEYGGEYFREAIRQIGHVLGLWHSYDLPSVMGESLPGENVFPSDYDILHLQQLYPRAGTEIDVYSFTLANDGHFRAETFAQRLLAEASTLDTVLSIYDGNGRLISRNNDSFGRDSRVALELAAGDYYIAVSSTGNTSFNLGITNSGLGGFTQGAYDLRLAHSPISTENTTIVDVNGTPLDGDRDGKAGGAFNFHFRTAAAADTIYVDKIVTDVLADVTTAADGIAKIELDDTSGITADMLVFGEGVPEGTAVISNDSATELTLSAIVNVSASTKLRFVTPGDGTLNNPYLNINDALAAATSSTAIIRVLGNDGSELTGISNNSGRPSLRPNVLVNNVNPYHYYVGRDSQGNPLADGTNLTVPTGVTLMIDAGATLRMAAANVEVGSSSELVSRSGAALQVLGTPERPVAFSSTLGKVYADPNTIHTQALMPKGGDWGGLVLRADSDWQPATKTSLAHDTLRPVLNSISNAIISHAGGQVVVDAELQSFAAIQIEDTRPTVAFSTVTYSAGAAVSATPNSFEESNGRVGPEFRGNTLVANSTNGVFIAITTEFGSPLDKLDVSARFASTEVTYVLQESLVIAGGAGSYHEDENGDTRARPSGRLQIDPGVVVKLQNSRIELERGASRLIAEGVGNNRIIFTSLGDNRFGAGGDFDTNGNLPNKFDDVGKVISPLITGDWGGIVLNAGASASIADAYLTFGGGEVPLEGGLDDFNVIEVHQADLRLVDTRIEANASGLAETSRNYRGINEAASIFVRGAQPIIAGNDFRNNAGATISINVNSLNDLEQGDLGRQVGLIDRYERFDSNRGPLLQGNRISNDTTGGGAIAGLAVRAEEITVESVWDDTDIVHVVTDEIIVNNFHTATGLRLESDTAASLVVKLDGPNAGFTASGELLDIDDRIGGTVQVVGQPGFPVVLTSLADDSVGASIDLLGFPVTDTNVDGTTTMPSSGDWRSLKFLPLANDRNVAVLNETELPYTGGQEDNNVIFSAEALGILAPNYPTGANTWESAQEKTGDENRRQGFEVHGAIAYDDPTDVDVYAFDGYAGSEVWIDVDKTSSSLDTTVELLDANGRVLARSVNSQTDSGATSEQFVTGSGVAEVTGIETAVTGAAAALQGVGSQVVGTAVRVTGVATRAEGYKTGLTGFGVQVAQPAVVGDTQVTLLNAADIRLKAALSRSGVIAAGTLVLAINANTVTLSQPLVGALAEGDWIISDFAGLQTIEVEQPVFNAVPQAGVWVGTPQQTNAVLSTKGDAGEVSILREALRVEPSTIPSIRSQSFDGGGFSGKAFGDAIVTDETGVITEAGNAFYRLTDRTIKTDDDGDNTTITPTGSRGLSWSNIQPGPRWQRITASVDVRSVPPTNEAAAVEEGFVFIFQNDGEDVPLPRDAMELPSTDKSINQVVVHLDTVPSGDGDGAKKHLSILWGDQILGGNKNLPFEVDDNQWRTIEFTLTPYSGGARLRVSMTNGSGPPITLHEVSVPGYSLTAATQFAVAAAGDSTLEDNRPGSLDIDNVRFDTVESTGTTSLITSLGLDATSPTLASDLLVDNAEAASVGQTLTGPDGPVTIRSRSVVTATISAFSEPNETQVTAVQPTITITDTGVGSSFVQAGWVGDSQYGGRDVDLFAIDVPAEARGATITLQVDTTSYDPLISLDDSYLRLFDADGNQVAFNDNADGTTKDSRLTFTVPNNYAGRGFFVGVSGAGNTNYSTLLPESGGSGSTGQYLLRGGFDVPFNTVTATLAGEVQTSQPVSLTAGQLLPVSLATQVEVATAYLTVDDVSPIVLGSQLSGLPGIPAGTRVVAIDAATNTLQLSQPVTVRRDDLPLIGFNDTTVSLNETSLLAVGMAVQGTGVPADTTVTAVSATDVKLSQRVNVAANQFLQFGFVGAPIETQVLFLDDTAATVGAEVSLVTNPENPIAQVTAVDSASGAVTLNTPLALSEGDLLTFSFASEPINARRVTVVETAGIVNTVLVNTVGAGLLDQRVPDGTTVIDAAVGGGIVELSNRVQIADGEQLGFGFNGLEVEVADVSGVVIGATVSGRGVIPGTTVEEVVPAADPDSLSGTVVFSQPANVEDAVILTFSEQTLDLLGAPEARGIVVLPGSVTGTVFVGSTSIQSFTTNRDGSLALTPISNPAARVLSGSIDYQTGVINLVFDTAPVSPVSIEVDYEFGNLDLETLGFSRTQTNAAWLNGAFPLMKDAYRGGDFYTTNPRDAGMRVTLPGSIGQQQKYFIRVRSQPSPGTDGAIYEANLSDESLLSNGQTSGAYELRVRTRQRDDKPGSTVRFADIRYPTIGIDVVGLPNNSPLVGTTGEDVVDANNSRQAAQQLGNLLTSDRNTISVAGAIATEGDVDWYQFSLSYEDIQSLRDHNNGDKSWATVFDIDYADGFRGDLTLSVYDAAGRLIYVGRDSNIADDQPGVGQGNDFDDLSRGSVGALDPFIGSAQLTAGSTTPQTYYVAVSSNERLPSALDGTLRPQASNPLARLEPVNSVRRMVEDHIGSTGYTTHDGSVVPAAGIIDVGSALELSANVRPFTLSDVTLYVSTSSALYTHNPFTSDRIATINTGYTNGAVGDIDMRTDGRLFQYASIGTGGRADLYGTVDNGTRGNEGKLRELDAGTGRILTEQIDGISDYPFFLGNNPRPERKNDSDVVTAVAIKRAGPGSYNEIYYAVDDSYGSNSRMYNANPQGAVYHDPEKFGGDNDDTIPGAGVVGVIQGTGIIGVTTGMQHLGDSGQLYGVNAASQFYRINESNAVATLLADFSELVPGGFQGLAAAPVNLYGGRFQNMFFAITGGGQLVVIDPDGAADGTAALIDNVFDTTGDGIADSYISDPTTGGATGLAFSPLDVNLWHPTGTRSTDPGHGINLAVDGTREEIVGGTSMYFGLDSGYDRYEGQGGQFGVLSNSWQVDLLTNPKIRQTYNLPGGAHGALITNSFSLAGYSYTDKPTLYFNYFLATNDSARVFASTDSGLTWSLLATNRTAELPQARSVSSRIGEAPNQLVQELFSNSGSWRQARVDLGEYAGAANIQLRFDFGGGINPPPINQSDSGVRRSVNTGGGAIGGGIPISSTPVVPLDSVEGLEVGMIVQQSSSQGIATRGDQLAVLDAVIRAIDVENRSITLSLPVTELQDGAELVFFKDVPPENTIVGTGGTDNQYEGFYIDDIIVGFAERGEMVTGARPNLTSFYDIGTPSDSTDYPQQNLTGAYQLEIRRGTEYAATVQQTANSETFLSDLMAIEDVYDTNARQVPRAGRTERILRENRLELIDGADLRNFGNGLVEPTGSAVRLSSDQTTPRGSTSNSMLAWYVDLADQPAAVLNYTVELSDNEQVNPLPAEFTYNAWKEDTLATDISGLPVGDGAAISTDGGETWKTIDNFAWSGSRSVDLVAAVAASENVGPLNSTTVIGFFRQGQRVVADTNFVEISALSISTATPEIRTGTIGDSNNTHEFEQGQFVITSNLISKAERFGVRVDAGRDTETDPDNNYDGSKDAPHLGVVRNLPVINNAELVPGVVIANNVISRSGEIGVLYLGDQGLDSQPRSAVPYGRIFNNTIVGGGQGLVDTGVVVSDAAGPTLLNNVFADLGTAVRVDESSRVDPSGTQRTVISTSAFYDVGVEVEGATQTQGITLTDDPFVDGANENFYPTANAPIVDSSLNALQDRNAYTVVTQPLGIAPSPIVTPTHDLYGQLRGDDPDQANAPGLGLNVFKDRGAIERIDQSAPTARLVGPLDQASQVPFFDKDPSIDSVRLEGLEARGLQQFVIQLEDVGVGVDRTTVIKEAVTLVRDGSVLTEGVDYFLQFNANTNQIILASTSVLDLGDYLVELRSDSDSGQLLDLAGNELLANASNGGEYYTSFAISLADIPNPPTGVRGLVGYNVAYLEWSPPVTSISTPVLYYNIEYSTDDGENWQSPPNGGQVSTPSAEVEWPNNEPRLYRVQAVNSIGVSLWSQPASVLASQPWDVHGIPGLQEVALTWKTPVNNAGEQIESYVVDMRLAGEAASEQPWMRVMEGLEGTQATIGNLVQGVVHEFRVAGRTAAGIGAWSNIFTGAAEGLPSAPTGIATRFDEDDGSLILSWVAPENTGGLPIEGYRIEFSADGINYTSIQGSGIDGATTTFDTDALSGAAALLRGTDYWFRVRAVNIHGDSEPSTALKAQTADVPQSRPRVRTVTPRENGFSLSWTAVGDGVLPVTKYLIQKRREGGETWTDVKEVSASQNSAEITGILRADGAHRFRVAAKNVIIVAAEELSWSDPTAAVLSLAKPSGVKDLQGEAGDKFVNLTWTALDDGGAPIFDYIVEYRDVTKQTDQWETFVDGISSATSLTVSGLTNGVDYEFQVTARTAVGDSVPLKSGVFKPLGLPTMVRELVATGNVGAVDLSWVTPESNGGLTIESYQVEYSTSSLGPWMPHGDDNPSDRVAKVAGLDKETPYFFRVAATTERGTGPTSDVAFAIPTGVPDSPTALLFSPNHADGSLRLSWTAPLNTGALPVVEYQLQYKLGGDSNWGEIELGNSTGLFAEVLGLDRGVMYDFRVRAKNSVGHGDWIVGNFEAPDTPAPPAGFSASSVAGQLGVIRLAWTAPVTSGGEFSVTDYVVQMSRSDLGSEFNWETIDEGVGTSTLQYLTGLERVSEGYVFRVAAKNALPGVQESDLQFTQPSEPVKPLGLSEEVRLLQATPGDEKILLSWNAPADTGGVSVTDYLVEINDGTGWQMVNDGFSSSTGAVVRGLVNGNSYSIRVKPKTSLGVGVEASVMDVTPYGRPAAPAAPSVVGDGGFLAVSWPSVSENGRPITDYVVQYAASLSGQWMTFEDGVSSSRSAAISDLPAGTEWYVRVAAINAAGTGTFSTVAGPVEVTAAN